MAQHCYSYFVFKYGRFKVINYFPAYHKTQVLGAKKTISKTFKNGKVKYKNISKYQRKKWSVNKAEEILKSNEPNIWKEITDTIHKKDDISDCLLMIQCFVYLFFISE